MSKKMIFKLIMLLLFFTIFSILISHNNVQATTSSTLDNTMDISIDSIIKSAEEENIVCYDCVTNETTKVDMEELRQTLISTYGENYTSVSTSAYIPSPKNLLFNSNIQPVATPYASIKFNKVSNTKIQPYSSVCKIICSGGQRIRFFS